MKICQCILNKEEHKCITGVIPPYRFNVRTYLTLENFKTVKIAKLAVKRHLFENEQT